MHSSSSHHLVDHVMIWVTQHSLSWRTDDGHLHLDNATRFHNVAFLECAERAEVGESPLLFTRIYHQSCIMPTQHKYRWSAKLKLEIYMRWRTNLCFYGSGPPRTSGRRWTEQGRPPALAREGDRRPQRPGTYTRRGSRCCTGHHMDTCRGTWEQYTSLII